MKIAMQVHTARVIVCAELFAHVG